MVNGYTISFDTNRLFAIPLINIIFPIFENFMLKYFLNQIKSGLLQDLFITCV